MSIGRSPDLRAKSLPQVEHLAGTNRATSLRSLDCASRLRGVLDDAARADRLREIGVAHFDHLFGRNPVGAHSCAQGPEQFEGVERGWPKHFPEDVCARLELVRGVLNSSAASEHFPFNPGGAFRHPEGWTAFNAAFNVGLAYAGWEGDGPKWLDASSVQGTLTMRCLQRILCKQDES